MQVYYKQKKGRGLYFIFYFAFVLLFEQMKNEKATTSIKAASIYFKNKFQKDKAIHSTTFPD